MTPEQLTRLSKSKDPDVKELLDEYIKIMDSNNLTAYVSMRDQLKSWDDQLIIKPDEVKFIIRNEGKEDEFTDKSTPGEIDLFADKDTKEFDRVIKYYDKIMLYRKTLSDLKSSLTEEEQAQVSESDSLKKSKEKNKMMAI